MFTEMRLPAAFLLMGMLGCAAQAQNSGAGVEFGVASVRPAAPPAPPGLLPPPPPPPFRQIGRGGPGTSDPERYIAVNMSFSELVTTAYDIQHFQLAGPASIDSARYDINAKIPKGATRDQFLLMLRNLLQERFGLAVHHESKQMAVDDLVVGKNGPKLKESTGEPAPEAAAPSPGRGRKFELDKDGFLISPDRSRGSITTMRDRARIEAKGETMSHLVETLSDLSGKPIVDSTGLTGKYDFTLSWQTAPPPLGDGASDVRTLPTLAAAVQAQLGLKLEPKKGPVDMLVIDRAGKVPSEN
jgi:uncharacterized protein (TIGR03435 family)